MSLLCTLGNILCVLTVTVSACSVELGLFEKLETFTLEQTLQRASIVVSGTDVNHDPQYDRSRNITFEVSCIFKSNDLDIPRTIFLMNVGAISCDRTSLKEGTSYIVGLQLATEDDITDFGTRSEYFGKGSDVPYYYVMDEPGILTTAAFEVTDAKLGKTADLCGFDDTFLSLGEGEAGDHKCPERDVTEETCVSGALRLTSAQMSSILGALLSLIVCTILSFQQNDEN